MSEERPSRSPSPVSVVPFDFPRNAVEQQRSSSDAESPDGVIATGLEDQVFSIEQRIDKLRNSPADELREDLRSWAAAAGDSVYAALSAAHHAIVYAWATGCVFNLAKDILGRGAFGPWRDRMRKRDGNDAIMFCSTTDAYQVIHHTDPATQRRFQRMARSSRRWMLKAIRDHSSLNVRILTRSPLARQDFDIFQSFGDRLLLGVSLPTLDQKISDMYEPKVSHPKQRLKLLTDAKAAGINTYVAVAPVYPEVGYEGILEVFEAVKTADPCTVFMEPVNLKLQIAERVQRGAGDRGHDIDMTPYTDSGAWADYAIRTLREAERAAEAAGISDRLHLWPDHEGLTFKSVIDSQPDPEAYLGWLRQWWNRVSEWPGRTDR